MLETVLGIVIGPSGVGWAKPDVVLARELLYRVEPELYGQVASAERLHLEVVGWLLRHVRPRDAMTVGPPSEQREASVCRAFPWGLPACSSQGTLRAMQWRGSGGPGPAAITLTRAWAWS